MLASFVSQLSTSSASSIPALRFSALFSFTFRKSFHVPSLLLRGIGFSRIAKFSAITTLVWSSTTSAPT